MGKKKKKKNKRVDLDVRPYPSPLWQNYDTYGLADGETEVSPGRGLYNGMMDTYESVKDFIEHSRKRMKKKKNKQALAMMLEDINGNQIK